MQRVEERAEDEAASRRIRESLRDRPDSDRRPTTEHTQLLAIQRAEAEQEKRDKAAQAKADDEERERRARGELRFNELSPKEQQRLRDRYFLRGSPPSLLSDERPTTRTASEISDYRTATPAERRAALRRYGL